MTAALLVLLAVSLGLKQALAGRPGVLDEARLRRDLAAAVAPTGYRLTRAPTSAAGYALEQGACRGRVAAIDLAAAIVPRERGIQQGFAMREERFGAARAGQVPASHWISHYTARTLARIGIDLAVTPYLMVGWDAGCPAPAPSFARVRTHYRKG
jgi:hypothetical protein